MADNAATQNKFQVLDLSADLPSDWHDDDGLPKRTGNVWTASGHIITAAIGSGVLSLPWAIAQLGWVAGPAVTLFFSLVTYYTATLLSACYRSGHPVTGKGNSTYMEAVRSNLDGVKFNICKCVLYANLFGVALGYTITASISMMAIKRSNCFHESGGKNPCHMNATPYMVAFGVVEIFLSQIPDFDNLSCFRILAVVMSFTYSTIVLGLGIAKVVRGGEIMGSATGISIGSVTASQKMWRIFQAIGDIAFAYSYSTVLFEIQDTIKAPPAEHKTMKKATLISVGVTALFYLLCGGFGYAAFGDLSPDNALTAFGFYNPYWLLDIANALTHLAGAYQVYCQPLCAFVEKSAAQRFPDNHFFKDKEIRIPFCRSYRLNLFRLVWRTAFVIFTTVISILLHSFNGIVGLLNALGFWPLTVYFPVEMYIAEKKIPKWSTRWLCLQTLSAVCLIIAIAAAGGSIAAIMGI